MKYAIDFSIFSSPTEAFGNATGELDFPSPPVIGQVVELVAGISVKIKTISSNLEGWTGTSLGLDDIVLEPNESAHELAKRLEVEMGLFVVPYHDE